MRLSSTLYQTKFNATGEQQLSLSDFTGKILVLYFYPKDDTSGCTQEGKDFSEHFAQFKKTGAVILGVSCDSVKKHEIFKAKYEFPFDLLADADKTLCQAFAVMKEKSMYGKKYLGIERSTFLLDQEGKIIHEWRNVKVPGHVMEVLVMVKKLSG